MLTFVGAHAGWRTAFVLVSLLAVLSAALVWRQARARPPVAARPSRPTLRSFRLVLSEPAIVTVMLSSLVGNAGVWTGLTYLGVLYQDRLGLGARMSAGPSPPSGSACSQGHSPRWTAALAHPLVAGWPPVVLDSACCSASHSSCPSKRPAWR